MFATVAVSSLPCLPREPASKGGGGVGMLARLLRLCLLSQVLMSRRVSVMWSQGYSRLMSLLQVVWNVKENKTMLHSQPEEAF